MYAATAFAFISNPNPLNLTLTHLLPRNTAVFVLNSVPISLKFSLTKSPSVTQLLFRVPYGSLKRSSNYSSSRTFYSPVMEWQDCTVKTEIDVPISVAYNAYSDREAIPRWMPFISSVKILEDKPEISQWSLKYKAFGRDIEFSWLARNLQPIPNQKIHWRSLEGLPNRGAVRFFPKGPSSCIVEPTRSGLKSHHLQLMVYFGAQCMQLKLTVSYEVPQILVPVASALQPFLENLLRRGLERFANFAKTY